MLATAFAVACAVVWVAAFVVLARAALSARQLMLHAKRIAPADLRTRMITARADAMRAKTAFAQLALVAVRAQIAVASIRRSLAAAQVVFRGLPRPSRNGRAR